MSNPRTLIYGQKIVRNPVWNFSFWRPRNWHEAELDTLNGVVVYPEDDPRTGFYVTVLDLGEGLNGDITAVDLPALYDGLSEGLRRLPDSAILKEQEIRKDKAMGFDFVLRFIQDDARCKQRLRVLYLKRRQYTIYGQGIPPEEYDVFENIFDYMYMTLKFGDLLLDMGVPPMPDFNKPDTL